MKKIITLAFFSALLTPGIAQVRSSIGVGNEPNSVKIYIKSDVAIPNVTGTTLQFDVAIPDVPGPVPNLTLKSFAIAPSWTLVPSFVEAGYRHYQIIADAPGAWKVNLAAEQEFEVMEVAFTDGPPQVSDVYNLTLGVCCGLPFGGGATIQSLFNCTVGNFTSQEGALYYIRPGTTTLNQNSYTTSVESWAKISGILLPVKFTSFTATKEAGNTAKLNWSVENQTATTDHYEIEASANGVDFAKVAVVKAGAESNYSLSNVKLNAAVTYFRIKQVDKDAKFVVSEVRVIKLDGKAVAISLYPNPVVTTAKATIDLDKASLVNITVSNAKGQIVKQIKLNGTAGVNVQEIDFNSLAAGSYHVKVTTATETKVIPVVKK